MTHNSPLCPKCGSNALALKDIAGSVEQRTRVQAIMDKRDELVQSQESQLQQLNDQLNSGLNRLKQELDAMVKAIAQHRTENVRGALNDDQDGVLQYLIDPNTELRSEKAEKSKAMAQFKAKVHELRKSAEVRIKALYADKYRLENDLLDGSGCNVVSLVYCTDCGMVVSAVPSPILQRYVIEKLDRIEMQLTQVSQQLQNAVQAFEQASENSNSSIAELSTTVVKCAEALLQAVTAPRTQTGISIEWPQ